MTLVPLGGLWWAVMALLAALAAGIYALRGRRRGDEAVKENRRFLAGLGLLTVCYLAVYKILLSQVPDFDFHAWHELPLQPCNVIALLSIAAVLTDSRILKGVCFYGGAVFAVMALLMPESGFAEVALLSVKGLGFYGFHGLVLVLSVSFATLGVYRPRYRDIPAVLAALAALCTLAHGVNLLLRATVYPEANFFFTCGLQGNPVLDALKAVIPVNLLYEMPLLLPMGLLCLLMTLAAQAMSGTRLRK